MIMLLSNSFCSNKLKKDTSSVINDTILVPNYDSIANNSNINQDTLIACIILDMYGEDPYEHIMGQVVVKSKIERFPVMDSVLADLTIKTAIMRDSIVKAVEASVNTQISYDKEKDLLLKKAIKGDIHAFCTFLFNTSSLCRENFPTCFYPYNLYVGEKYGFAPAYYQVYEYLGFLDSYYQSSGTALNNRKTTLNDSQIDLLMYCLIKSYNEGRISSALILSHRFKHGVCVPKNIEIANELKSIYDNYRGYKK